MAEIKYDEIDNETLPFCPDEGDYEECFDDTLATILEEINTLKHRAEDLILSLRIRTTSLPKFPTLKDVMTAWLKKQYNISKLGPPTWRLLVAKVADDNGGADRALAMRIAKLHPIGSTIIPKQPNFANVTATQETYDSTSSYSIATTPTTVSTATTPTTVSTTPIKLPSFPEKEEEDRSRDTAPPTYPGSVGKFSSVCSGKEENRNDEEDSKPPGYSHQVSDEASLHPPNHQISSQNFIPSSSGFPSSSTVEFSVPEPVADNRKTGEEERSETDGKGSLIFGSVKSKSSSKVASEQQPVPAQPSQPLSSPPQTQPPVSQSQAPVPQSQAPIPQSQAPVPQSQVPVAQSQSPAHQPEQQEPPPALALKAFDPLQPYKMPKEGGFHGHALIINNICIAGRDKRLGADKDDENLEKTFNTLGYKCHRYRDKKASEMDQLINHMLTQVDHKQCDSFVLCLLSHGDSGKIFGSDDQPVYIDKIKESVIDCPSLVGKPKIFILQACRGGYLPGARSIQIDDHTSTDRILLPEESDLFFGYATTPHTKACRFTDEGSWYIIELCEALKNYYKDLDLLSMVQLAHYQVATKEEYTYENRQRTRDGQVVWMKYKQSPQMVSTLIRPVRF